MVSSSPTKLLGSIGQLARFSTVGVANTAIDFLVTNILVLLLSAEKGWELGLISVVACLTAMVNSFFWNKRWTFRHTGALQGTSVARFVGIALLSMVINTSVFLFTFHYLSEGFALPKFVGINLSKLAGVVVALSVSFVGYKLTVFGRAHLEAFRDRFRFDTPPFTATWVWPCLVLVCAAAAVRLLYLCLTTAVFGDAVSYAKVAQGIASGQMARVDAFWSNPFCFWEALFPWLGLGRIPSAIAASFIPGILLPVPIALMARRIYGDQVAWLAGGLAVVHPRLVEYSCNGYAETFYLLALTTAVLFLVLMAGREHVVAYALACGAAFGLYVGVRNEGLVPMVACLVGVVVIELCFNRAREQIWRLARLLAGVTVGFVLVLGVYVALSEHTFATSGMFQKLHLQSKVHLEQLDWHAAAKEAYGKHDAATTSLTTSEKLDNLADRVYGNVGYVMQRLPGVLLTPICFFALLLPLLSKGEKHQLLMTWPLLVLLFFPLLMFPLMQVEPRYLFPILIPIQIFGAAGLYAFCSYIGERYPGVPIYPAAVGVVLFFSVAMAMVTGWHVERAYRINRPLAAWIERHVPKDDLLVGDGYGYLANTAYLAGYPSLPRLWSSDPRDVVGDVRSKKARWLVLYEDFLKKSNPELLPVLSQGMPGMTLRHQETDWNGDRVQVYELQQRRYNNPR